MLTLLILKLDTFPQFSEVCFTILDQGVEMIILESILTTFIAIVFVAFAGAVVKINNGHLG